MLTKKSYDIDSAVSCLSTERAKVVFRQLTKIYPDMTIFWDEKKEEAILEDDEIVITVSGNI